MTRDQQVEFGKFVTDWEAANGPVDDATPELQEQFHETARRMNGLDPQTGRRPGSTDQIPMTRSGRPI